MRAGRRFVRMTQFMHANYVADALSARTRAELLRDWSGRVDTHALFEIACELYINEEFEHAAVLFRYLLAFRTRAPSVWSWLGACLEAQDDRQGALLVYHGALAAFGVGKYPVPGALQPSKHGFSIEQRDEFVARIRALGGGNGVVRRVGSEP